MLLVPGVPVHAQAVPFELTDGTPVAFVNVTVIPMDRTTTLVNHTVTIDNGFITGVGPDGSVVIPDGAVVIDGANRFVVPGLVDLHTHLGAEVGVAGGIGENQVQVYLAKGVTTILNQGDFLIPFGNGLMSLAQRIRDGEIAGPTIYTASYARGSADTGTPQQIVSTALDGRDHVVASKAAGYDYIKVYNQTPLAAFDGIVDQSRVENMSVIGHFPHPVGTAKALADGMVMVAHAWAYFWTHFSSAEDPSLIVPAINQTLAAGAWVNTTLYIVESIAAIWGGNQAAFDAFLAKPQMRYVHPAEIDVWRQGFEGPRWSPAGSRPGDLDSQFAFVKRYTRDFYDAGIRLTLGTDSPTVLGAPGFSTHEEMRVLGQLGLSSFEVLTIATRNPGDFVAETLPNAEPFGTIEVGKRADLLLLDSDPLADLSNLERTVGVMVRGRWYSRESLDGRLDTVAAEYASINPIPLPPPNSGSGGGALDIHLLSLLLLGLAFAVRRVHSR
jgi:hypothetical protein